MYPFERFSADAKRTLTLAQEEAERAHHSYIGTEHLLLGLLRLKEGAAHEVLTNLGIDIDEVRRTIASVLGRNERIIIQQIIPTSRVKMVIEIAFEEARRFGHDEVNSGHLLMALVMEGEGIAAHVLADLGATAEKVVAAVEKELDVEPSGRGTRPRSGFPLRMPTLRISDMRMIARLGQAVPPESDAETLHRLLGIPHVAALLRAKALDVDGLYRALQNPPASVLKLRQQLNVARSHLAEAVSENDFERAAQVQKTVKNLTEKLAKAEEDWLGSLGR